MMEVDKVSSIRYTKADTGEITDRLIIPTTIPTKNVKAIDVTSLNDSQRDELETLHTEYSMYRNRAIQNIYNFEDWVSMTTGKDSPDVKWRSFLAENVEEM